MFHISCLNILNLNDNILIAIGTPLLCVNCFVVITIIHHSTEGVFILCNIWYLLIHSYQFSFLLSYK